MGLPRPPGSTIALPATSCGHTLPVVIAPRLCAGPGGDVTTHYFAPYGHERPAETQGCIAVSPRLLLRMRSEASSLRCLVAPTPTSPSGVSQPYRAGLNSGVRTHNCNTDFARLSS